MSGGLLAISKQWWDETGGYDKAMAGWGGENIDQSLRIWTCGGEIVSAPDSYIAHMWRDGSKGTQAGYTVSSGDIEVNRARAAKINMGSWFDKTLTFPTFAGFRPEQGLPGATSSKLDVSVMVQKKKDLKCKDFGWYLNRFKNIYADGGLVPSKIFQLKAVDRSGKAWCLVRSSGEWNSAGAPDGSAKFEECEAVGTGEKAVGESKTYLSSNQWWHPSNRLTTGAETDGKCCSGIRAWNTDQCLLSEVHKGELSVNTRVCDMQGPSEQQIKLVRGKILVGSDDDADKQAGRVPDGRCLHASDGADGPPTLEIGSCKAMNKLEWEVGGMHEPMEFRLLDKATQKEWIALQTDGSAAVLRGHVTTADTAIELATAAKIAAEHAATLEAEQAEGLRRGWPIAKARAAAGDSPMPAELVSLEEAIPYPQLVDVIKSPGMADQNRWDPAWLTAEGKPDMTIATPPDTRHEACKNIDFETAKLPTFSVVIPYHCEGLMLFRRTLISILTRSPVGKLEKIVVVSDGNDDRNSDCTNIKPDPHRHLVDYLAEFPKVQVVTNAKREGLIRSKVIGAEHATGDVVIFLESHVEVNVQWAEPLLTRIMESPTAVVLPVTDMILEHDLSYVQAGDHLRGGFGYDMVFKWISAPSSYKFPAPLPSPAMSGGLLAMRREYWHKLGEYDMSMEIWGAENIEMSLRVWQCGGSVEIIPCSRVGHVYKDDGKFAYSFPDHGGTDPTVFRNYYRTAAVWLDEHLQDAYTAHPTMRDFGPGGQNEIDISKRVALRKELKCKSMDWYLKTVYPELDHDAHAGMN